MELWFTVLLWSLAGSAVSLIAGFLLLSKKLSLRLVQIYAVPFAAGSLLAASFLDLLPEAFTGTDTRMVAIASLAGFLVFFVLERFLGWFHHHHEHSATLHPTVKLLVIGDTLHNFIDGLVIGAAFLVDVPTGVIVTLAVAAHEIPQEIGDFGLMLSYGASRGKVIALNIVSALSTAIAAMTVVMLGGPVEQIEPYLLAVAAGFFIYIAAADIIPAIHAETEAKTANTQTVMLLVGIVIIGLFIGALHDFAEPSAFTGTFIQAVY